MITRRYVTLFIIFTLTGFAAACGEHEASHSDDHTHHDYHRITHWDNNLEVFVRFELHENSGRIEGALFMAEENQPVENITGEIQFAENGTTVTRQKLEMQSAGVYPFELYFQNSDEPYLNIVCQINGEEYNLNLGTVNRYTGHPDDPDIDNLVELDKQMQWRMSIASEFAGFHEIPDVVSGFGTIRYDPNFYHEITSPVDGYIRSGDIDMIPASGMSIQTGDLLTTISPLLSSENSWVEYRIDYRQAEEAFERAKLLIENEAISLREYQQREREYEIRKAGYEQFVRSNYQGLEIEYNGNELDLRSRYNGIIAESFLISGREVKQGDSLFTIFNPDRLWLETLVFRDEFERLNGISGAEIHTNRNERITLNDSHIDFVSRDLRSDASGSRSKITLSVDNSGRFFSPGQPVRVKLRDSTGEPQIAVPVGSIFDDESHKVVFVMHSGDQFERRLVQTGTSYGGLTAILDGLNEGERVVTKGIYPLHLMTGNVQFDDDHDH